MTVISLQFLNWAPLIYMFFGYWMMGNRQIFGNLCLPFTYSTEALRSGHLIFFDLTKIKFD